MRNARVPRYGIVALAATIGVAVGLGVALIRDGRGSSSAGQQEVSALAAQATWPAGAKRAPSFALRDQEGHPVSLRSLRGRPVLLTFLDSVCKRECPIEGRVLRDIQRRVRGTGAVTAVVSVDPWADTGATALGFARKARWEGSWQWFLGTKSRLAPVWRAYGIGVRRRHGDVAHSVVLYVIDSRGYLRAGYLFPFAADSVARNVRQLAN